jgi:cytoskeletal protein RodZ
MQTTHATALLIKAIEMDTEQIEKLFWDGLSPPCVSRTEVRRWVVDEQRRGSRRRRIVGSSLLLVFVLTLGGLWSLLETRADEVRQMVHRHPTYQVKNLAEITREVCHQPPAEYFVRQLSGHRQRGGISTLNRF